MKLLLTALALVVPALLGAGDYKTKNLVLVTTDGLRWQEVFRGIDPLLMGREDTGMKNAEHLRTSLWANSPEQRRRLLMPFLWNELAPRGVIFGNGGEAVEVYNFSPRSSGSPMLTVNLYGSPSNQAQWLLYQPTPFISFHAVDW